MYTTLTLIRETSTKISILFIKLQLNEVCILSLLQHRRILSPFRFI